MLLAAVELPSGFNSWDPNRGETITGANLEAAVYWKGLRKRMLDTWWTVCGEFVPFCTQTLSVSYQTSINFFDVPFFFLRDLRISSRSDVWLPGRGDPVDPGRLRRQPRRRTWGCSQCRMAGPNGEWWSTPNHEKSTPIRMISLRGGDETFGKWLKDGRVLCSVANKIQPGRRAMLPRWSLLVWNLHIHFILTHVDPCIQHVSSLPKGWNTSSIYCPCSHCWLQALFPMWTLPRCLSSRWCAHQIARAVVAPAVAAAYAGNVSPAGWWELT